jgi:hypothetical protein
MSAHGTALRARHFQTYGQEIDMGVFTWFRRRPTSVSDTAGSSASGTLLEERPETVGAEVPAPRSEQVPAPAAAPEAETSPKTEAEAPAEAEAAAPEEAAAEAVDEAEQPAAETPAAEQAAAATEVATEADTEAEAQVKAAATDPAEAGAAESDPVSVKPGKSGKRRTAKKGEGEMSLLDNLKKLAGKNPEKTGQAIDKAAEVADKKTGGKHTDMINTGADKAKDALGGEKSADSKDSA